MAEDRELGSQRTKDGVLDKNVSNGRNATYKPSVPSNYNPPPPAQVPPPVKQGK